MSKLIRSSSIIFLITITGCNSVNVENPNTTDPFAIYKEITHMDIIGIIAVISIVSFFCFLSLFRHCEKIINYDFSYKGITRDYHPLDKESNKMFRRMIVSIILAIICSSIFIHTKGLEGVKDFFTPNSMKKEEIETHSE